MRDVIGGQGKAAILAIGLASILVAGILDYLTGSEIPLAIIYLLPIYFVAWQAGEGTGLLLALFSSAIWFAAGHFAGRLFPSILSMLWQTLSMAALACAFAVLPARLHKARSRSAPLPLVAITRAAPSVIASGQL